MTNREMSRAFNKSKQYFDVIKITNPKKYNRIKSDPYKYIESVRNDIDKVRDMQIELSSKRLQKQFANYIVRHGAMKNPYHIYEWFTSYFRVFDDGDIIGLSLRRVNRLRRIVELYDKFKKEVMNEV